MTLLGGIRSYRTPPTMSRPEYRPTKRVETDPACGRAAHPQQR